MTRQKALRILALDALAGNNLLIEGLRKLQQLVAVTQHLLPEKLAVDCSLPRGRRVRLVIGSMNGVRPLKGVDLQVESFSGKNKCLRVVGRASSRSHWQRLDRTWLAVVDQVHAWGGPAGLAELVLAVERARKLVLRTLEKETSWL